MSKPGEPSRGGKHNATVVGGTRTTQTIQLHGTACASPCASPSAFDARRHTSDETNEIKTVAKRAAAAAGAAATAPPAPAAPVEGPHALPLVTGRQIVTDNSHCSAREPRTILLVLVFTTEKLHIRQIIKKNLAKRRFPKRWVRANQQPEAPTRALLLGQRCLWYHTPGISVRSIPGIIPQGYLVPGSIRTRNRNACGRLFTCSAVWGNAVYTGGAGVYVSHNVAMNRHRAQERKAALIDRHNKLQTGRTRGGPAQKSDTSTAPHDPRCGWLRFRVG